MKSLVFPELRPALSLMLLLTAITGLAYPLLVTGIANLAFPDAASGSIIIRQGKAVGSRLIGQDFTAPRYFWGRPSATSPQAYNGLASGGSNQGPLNPALTDAVKARIAALRAADPDNKDAIPADLISSSASGLDPEISPAAANWQVGRIARVRQLRPEVLGALVQQHLQARQWGMFGEPRVNVLQLNIALDALSLTASPEFRPRP